VSTLSRLAFLSTFIALSALRLSAATGDAVVRRDATETRSSTGKRENSATGVLFLFGSAFIAIGLMRRAHRKPVRHSMQ
jgi:hypothetical protein